MYQSCKEHDFNRNDEINNRNAIKNKNERINGESFTKNSEPKILFTQMRISFTFIVPLICDFIQKEILHSISEIKDTMFGDKPLTNGKGDKPSPNGEGLKFVNAQRVLQL